MYEIVQLMRLLAPRLWLDVACKEVALLSAIAQGCARNYACQESEIMHAKKVMHKFHTRNRG